MQRRKSITKALMVLLTGLGSVALRDCYSAEPYCGLYSAHAALHALGIDADLDKMVVPENLSQASGSTALDLVHLVKKYGAAATIRSGLTVASLRAATCPIVLHTAMAVAETGFHHWVLFLGMDGDLIKIYDPPRGLYSVSGAELSSYWDGIGVVIERADNQSIVNELMSIPLLNPELLFAVLLVLIAGGLLRRIAVSVINPACGILIVASISAAVWHTTVDYGFLRNRDALTNIAARFDRRSIPIITSEQMRHARKRGDVSIVDARLPGAYNSSHIPDAINVPITVTHGELRDALRTIHAHNHVVVYCQSEHCMWSDAIARQFTARGYDRVSVFRAGMNAWETNVPGAR